MKQVGTFVKKHTNSSAFTIVELIIVIVVIAILAAVTTVAYNGVSAKAKETALKADVESAAKQLLNVKTTSGELPSNTGNIIKATTTSFQYNYDNVAGTFCLQATSSSIPDKVFYITNEGNLLEGECPATPVADGDYIQTITNANCPTTRTRGVDARDDHTYWVQKLADDKCWMLTNLAYAGGGNNTYGDTKVLTDGTGGSSGYTTPSYYVVTSTTNYTVEPTEPSTATDGGVVGNSQYGYLYSWCAAMGGQLATSACANAATPTPDTTISICPAGWRLPTGQAATGEFTALNNAVNGGSTTSFSGLLTSWLGQRGGYWLDNFLNKNSRGYYWTSTQSGSTAAYSLYFYSGTLDPANTNTKRYGSAVRCVAN